MLIDKIGSISQDFILKEWRTLRLDEFGYINELLATFDGISPNKFIGIAFMLLEKHIGNGAAIGFMVTLQLFKRHAESCSEKTWIDSQYLAVQSVGSDVMCEYVASFIANPEPEMKRLSKLLAEKTLMNGYMVYADLSYSGFSQGALLLIGMLLKGEESLNTIVTNE